MASDATRDGAGAKGVDSNAEVLSGAGPVASDRAKRWWLGLMVLLLLVYAAQVPGHMRMMNDSLSYFARTHNLLEGRGLFYDDGFVNHPAGYSVLLAGMITLGLDNVYWFIAVNVLSLAAGLGLMWVYWRRLDGFGVSVSAGLACVFMLSWSTAKHVPMLYTELVFFVVTVGALLLCEWAMGMRWGPVMRGRWWGKLGVLAGAGVLIGAAVMVRTIAVAALPALVWAGLGGWPGVRGVLRVIGRERLRLVGVVLVGALVFGVGVYVVVTSRYFENLMYRFRVEEHPIGRLVYFRLQEVGKLVLNMPGRALRATGPGEWLVYPAGVVFFGLAGWGLWLKRWRWTASDVYVVGSAGILAIWQSFDTRFWLPLFPMILALQWRVVGRWVGGASEGDEVGGAVASDHATSSGGQAGRWVCYGLAAYLVVYGLLGAGAIGRSVYLTYLGTGYSERAMFFRESYRVAYGEMDEAEVVGERDRRAVNLIRRYDPRTPAELRGRLIPIVVESEGGDAGELGGASGGGETSVD
ncbi:MAG: hypothetical protein AAF797_10930 [Planctomycetota bacterium]